MLILIGLRERERRLAHNSCAWIHITRNPSHNNMAPKTHNKSVMQFLIWKLTRIMAMNKKETTNRTLLADDFHYLISVPFRKCPFFRPKLYLHTKAQNFVFLATYHDDDRRHTPQNQSFMNDWYCAWWQIIADNQQQQQRQRCEVVKGRTWLAPLHKYLTWYGN